MITTLTSQKLITEYWNSRAQSYHLAQRDSSRIDPETMIWRTMLQRILPASPLDILDVGTGCGFLAHHLAGLGHRVTGIDLSEQMLLHAQSLNYVNSPLWMTGDAVAPDFPSGSVDAVTGRNLMWTLRDPVAAAVSWRRVLRPGGRVLMFDAPWFPRGLEVNQTPDFASLYSPRVRDDLPLVESRSIDDSARVLRLAGFAKVAALPLRRLYRMDTVLGATPGHEVTLQYVITGISPRC